jgi:diketogulonate reductase-like aldo/keto reductase
MITPKVPTHVLPGGSTLPLLGLGTWQLEGAQAVDAVAYALDIGYRHVDTATGYSNEVEVGRGLVESGVARTLVFVTTKCPPENVGHERETIEKSLKDLGLDYVDLWLVHWPPNGEARPETWREFIRARDDELVREIGVSNYSIAQIDELIEATGVTPAVNQIPWSPKDFDPDLLAAHTERGIVLEAYSPLKRSDLNGDLLREIAEEYGVTPSQVVLQWHLAHGIAVLAKSANHARITANLDAVGFALAADDVAAIDALGHG